MQNNPQVREFCWVNRSLFLMNPLSFVCKICPFTLLSCCCSNRGKGRVFIITTLCYLAPMESLKSKGRAVSKRPLFYFGVSPSGLDSIRCSVLSLYDQSWGHCSPASWTYPSSIAISCSWKTFSGDGNTLFVLPFHLACQKLHGAVSSPVCLFRSHNHFISSVLIFLHASEVFGKWM